MKKLNTYRVQATTTAALLVLLAGCGGGGGDGAAPALAAPAPVPAVQFTVGGTVAGLRTGAALTLVNGSEKLVVAANGAFTLATRFNTGASYDIKVTAPDGYQCKATGASGTVPGANSTATAIECAPTVLAGVHTALQTPVSVAADSAGAVYVFDDSLQSVMKVEPSGVVSLVAGGMGKVGFADGSGSAARFHSIGEGGLALDAHGNLFLADWCNGAVRKITKGVVTTLAGNEPARCNNVQSDDYWPQNVDGTGAAARFEALSKLVPDGAGGVFVLSELNQLGIRHVSAAGVVTTSEAWADPDDEYNHILSSFARGADGTFYVANTNRIWKAVGGQLVPVAGGRSNGPAIDGQGDKAQFNGIFGMVAAPNGDLYIADNATVRKVSPQGQVTTLAGNSEQRGVADGQGSAAQFSRLTSISFAGTDLMVLDTDRKTLRKVTLDGTVMTLAATPPVRGTVDGVGGAARLNFTTALTADADGNLLFGEPVTYQLRKATPGGEVTTIAGQRGLLGLTDGPLASALLSAPKAMAVSRDGAIWLADSGLRRIANGVVITIDRTLRIANLAVDAEGNAIVTGNRKVMRVTPAGARTELFGEYETGQLTGQGNFIPQAVAVDADGNIYVADTGNVVVWKYTKAGQLSVFAGTVGKETGDIDGPAGTATLGFYSVDYMTIDDKGNLYLSGQGGVRMISPAGVVSSPSFGWGNAVVGPIVFSKGKLYGVTRYALVQTLLP